MGLCFRGSAENSIACAVVISLFIFVDGKQPRNPRKFEPLEIYYPYGIRTVRYRIAGNFQRFKFSKIKLYFQKFAQPSDFHYSSDLYFQKFLDIQKFIFIERPSKNFKKLPARWFI